MLEVFFASEYARGISCKERSIDFFWSKTYGPTIFKDIISGFAYQEIRKLLRFDIKMTDLPTFETFLTDLQLTAEKCNRHFSA